MLKITPCQEVTCSCSLYVAKSATIRKPILASYFSSCPVKSENCQHLCTLTTASSNNNTSTAAANKSAKGNVFCATLPCPVSYFIFIFFFSASSPLHVHIHKYQYTNRIPDAVIFNILHLRCICSALFGNLRNFEIALRILSIAKLRAQFRNCVHSTQFGNTITTRFQRFL